MSKCSASVVEGFNLNEKNVETVFKTKPVAWKNGGAYISLSKKFADKTVYVVVVKEKNKK